MIVKLGFSPLSLTTIAKGVKDAPIDFEYNDNYLLEETIVGTRIITGIGESKQDFVLEYQWLVDTVSAQIMGFVNIFREVYLQCEDESSNVIFENWVYLKTDKLTLHRVGYKTAFKIDVIEL